MKCRRVHRRGLSAPEIAIHATGKAPGPRWPGRKRKSGKGGTRASPESLPVWRSRSSPGPFPLVHVRFDATIPSGSFHASPSGRFPTAGSDDSSCEVRCAWFLPDEGRSLCVLGGNEVTWRPHGRRGNSGTGAWIWKGGFARRSRDARAWAPFVHSPLASQSIGRRHLALCRRHAHSVTDLYLVKKCCANLSSQSSRRRVSLHDRRTATPLRGFISPASVFPCIGTGRLTIWACVVRPGSLQATAELRRCRAGPCGKLVGEVHPPAREAPTLGRAATIREDRRDQAS